jgi:hypothetical protein
VEKARAFSCSSRVAQAIDKLGESESTSGSHLAEWSVSKEKAYRFGEDLRTQGRWKVD